MAQYSRVEDHCRQSSRQRDVRVRAGNLSIRLGDRVFIKRLATGQPQLANKVAETLKNYKIILLRDHGNFATGQTLDEAFQWSSYLQESCQMELAAKIINEPFIEYRGLSDSSSPALVTSITPSTRTASIYLSAL